ncbi:MAG TPA: glycosyltransferase [Candidatus Saccharimonadales bacterium]|nr:glycosyltransferase [Candidatus Saccharimonadales bacterium]
MKTNVTVVIATKDRASELTQTLNRLLELPEQPAITVVDNHSHDQTSSMVRQYYPSVRLITLNINLGGAARNVGAAAAATDYVAFSDDDSWWQPGSLKKAASILKRHPTVGLVAAHIRVEPAGRADPVCAAMANSPLPARPGLPGKPILGFLACAAVVNKSAFLAAGGFEQRMLIGGEEELLSLDLATKSWDLIYVEDIVALHQPSRKRDTAARQRRQARNKLWTAWLRRPLPVAFAMTFHTLLSSNRAERLGAIEAGAALGWALRHRVVIPPELEQRVRLL